MKVDVPHKTNQFIVPEEKLPHMVNLGKCRTIVHSSTKVPKMKSRLGEFSRMRSTTVLVKCNDGSSTTPQTPFIVHINIDVSNNCDASSDFVPYLNIWHFIADY